jgi:hypothetical protein
MRNAIVQQRADGHIVVAASRVREYLEKIRLIEAETGTRSGPREHLREHFALQRARKNAAPFRLT